jgi:hypothetical protein
MANHAAYQIVTGGHAGTIVGSFDLAMRHLARTVARSLTDRHDADPVALFGAGDDYPALAAAGAGGSYFQRVRYALQSSNIESVDIEEHNLDAAPGRDSVIASFDIKDGFDPSYLVQAALYRADDTDDSPDEIATDLRLEFVSRIRSGFAFGADGQAFVRRLRRVEELMGGTPLVPAEGDAEAILGELPQRATERFRELFARAYPGEAATPAP